jgi:hypothetical protein
MILDFFANLFVVLSDLIAREVPKIRIDMSTIIPLGATLKTYEVNIPVIAEKTAKAIDKIAVCLNPLENNTAVTFGTTISDEVSNMPTSCIELTTVIAEITTRR